MKKKNIIAVISIVMMLLTLTACGKSRPNASDITVNRERRGEAAIPDENMENEANAEDVETAGAKKGIVFGSLEAAGYQDFNYLTEQLLSTSKTASKIEKTFSVYIPKEENPRVSGASVRSENAGVHIKVDLEPYLQYKAQNYSVRANLEKYVAGEMDYYNNYYDVIVGNVEESENAAVCEVSYMEYDFYEDSYAPYYVVYSLYDLGDNVMALVTLSVDAEHATEETGKLIEELSDFYQLNIHWDEEFAQTKREKFEEKYTGNIYSVDCLTFKLPDGWEIDENMTDDYETYFAPGGDAEEACGGFVIAEISEALGIVDFFLEDMEELQWELEQELENESDFVSIEDAGITFLGRTVEIRVVMTLYDEWEVPGSCVLYLAEDDNNLYMIYAYSLIEDEAEVPADLSDEVEEAVTMFFDTGRVTDNLT